MKLDDKDKQILMELQDNCKQSTRKLSKKLGMPATTIHQRIKRLEREKVITGHHAKVDPKKVGYPASAIIFLQAQHFPQARKKPNKESMPMGLEEVSKFPQVQEAYATTGEDDIIIKVIGKDDRDIGSFVVNTLREVPAITRTRTGIIVFTGKSTHKVEL